MVIKPSSTRKYQTLKDLQIVRPTKELPVKYSGMELGSVALKNKHSTAVINTQHTPSSRVRGAPANDPYQTASLGLWLAPDLSQKYISAVCVCVCVSLFYVL